MAPFATRKRFDLGVVPNDAPAGQLDPGALESLQKLFDAAEYDDDLECWLTVVEVFNGLRRVGYRPNQIESIVNDAVLNGLLKPFSIEEAGEIWSDLDGGGVEWRNSRFIPALLAVESLWNDCDLNAKGRPVELAELMRQSDDGPANEGASEYSQILKDSGSANSGVRANNAKIFPMGQLENRDLAEFVLYLDEHRGGDLSDNEIARQYKGETKEHCPEATKLIANYRQHKRRGKIGI